MFEALQRLDGRLWERYLTLKKNVENASNSFFDAYLDLSEQFLRYIARDAALPQRATCGELLHNAEVLKRLCEISFDYAKLQDYVLKINRHKHGTEKVVTVQHVEDYLKVLHRLYRACCAAENMPCEQFDENEAQKLFGLAERERQRLCKEVLRLTSELEKEGADSAEARAALQRAHEMLDRAQTDKNLVAEDNENLRRQIIALQQLKLSALENKLNKTLALLLELRECVAENRVATSAIHRLICGSSLSEKELAKEREALEIK